MVDPVFVDTSEGRAVVADSVKTQEKPSTIEKETKEDIVISKEKQSPVKEEKDLSKVNANKVLEESRRGKHLHIIHKFVQYGLWL